MEKGKGMMIFIIALLIVLIGLLVFVLISVLNINKKGASEDEPTNDTEVSEVINVEFGMTETYTLTVATKTTNLLTGTDGASHTIRIGISLGIYKGESKTDIKEYDAFIGRLSTTEAVVWDTVLSAVRNTSYKDLTKPDGPDVLAEAILVRLREIYQNERIVAIYIDDFIII